MPIRVRIIPIMDTDVNMIDAIFVFGATDHGARGEAGEKWVMWHARKMVDLPRTSPSIHGSTTMGASTGLWPVRGPLSAVELAGVSTFMCNQ